MSESRRNALRALERLLSGKSGGEALAGDPLASEIAYGTVRHLLRLDWIIERAGGKKLATIEGRALNIIRLGAYQLMFMPSIPAYAAVFESVATAKAVHPKAAGFVNWLLRRIGPEWRARPVREEVESETGWLSLRHSFPLWVAERWAGRYGGEEACRMMDAMNRFPPLDVRVNLRRLSRKEAAHELEDLGAAVRQGRYAPSALHVEGRREITGSGIFAAGGLYIQDESSQLPAQVVAPKKGERILDACCGVGGKAGHLAELSGGQAEITAVDSDGRRLSLLAENMCRLGHDVTSVRADILRGLRGTGEGFDGILVDAPCSSLGIIRRHPEIKWAKKKSDPARLAGTQLAILAKTAALCRPGGRVVYSTCTTEPEENAGVIERFLAEHRDFSIAPAAENLPHLKELETREGFLVTLPHRHGVNGGFTALLRRQG